MEKTSESDGGEMKLVAASEGIRGSEFKLKCNKLPLNVSKKPFLTVSIIVHWKQRGLGVSIPGQTSLLDPSLYRGIILKSLQKPLPPEEGLGLSNSKPQ